MKAISSILVFLMMFLTTTTSIAQSSTSYCTKYNDFAQLRNDKASINGDCLQHANETSTSIIVLDTTFIDSQSDYKYYLKFANLHNKEGKNYKVKGTDGRMTSVASTQCGLVFNHNGRDYWTVTARCSNTNLYDEAVDVRSMTIELSKVVNGQTTIVEAVKLYKEVNLDDSYNYLCVQIDGQEIKVMAGKNSLKEIINHKMTPEELGINNGCDHVKVGYIVGPGAEISIERAVLTKPSMSKSSDGHPVNTQWTREALDSHFQASKNPYEGYWVYLDRDMEDTWLKLGGRYTIALVETANGYDLIYIDGAQVKKSQWLPGMKKGEMTKTIFTDNFTGKWIDSTFELIDEDVYAVFESGVILTFKFPVYKSQIRFSKVLDIQ